MGTINRVPSLLVTGTWTALLAVSPLVSGAAGVTYTVLPDGTGDYETIQAAVAAAPPKGAVIELGDGTFSGDGNRDVDYMGKAVTIRSAGGDPNVCIINASGGRGFVLICGEGPDSVLEGVTVTGGYGSAPGGGMRCVGSSPTLRDVIFQRNFAAGSGGGLYCSGGSPTLEGVVFDDNILPGSMAYKTYGGGMCCEDCSPTLTNVRFLSNAATHGGGMYCTGGRCKLTDVEFSDNFVHYGLGAGLVCVEGELVNVRFDGNWAGYGAVFGGMYCVSGSLTDVVFSSNEGGAMYGRDVALENVTFADNDGGLYCEYGSVELTNVTFWANSGSMVYCLDSTVTIANSMIVFTSGAAVRDPYGTSEVTATCSNVFGNAAGDWVGPLAGQQGVDGNICRDPYFCYDENPDYPYSLHSNSCCLPFSAPNEECDLIGAWPEGCGPSAVERSTWGAIKAMYR